MLCIQKTKRREPSRQVSFCGKVIAGGMHFSTLSEAARSNKPVCEQCLIALNVDAEMLRKMGKEKKATKKPQHNKVKPVKKTKPKPNRITLSPKAPKISIEQTDIFKNKELFIAYAIIKMGETGQLNSFMAKSDCLQIAIQHYYYHRSLKDIAFECGISSYVAHTKAKSGLLAISEQCPKEAVFSFEHWPKSSIWKMKRILLMLALAEQKCQEV